jgi:hypothetical protein
MGNEATMASATIGVPYRRRERLGRRFEDTVRELLTDRPRRNGAPARDLRLRERAVRYVRSARQSLQ